VKQRAVDISRILFIAAAAAAAAVFDGNNRQRQIHVDVQADQLSPGAYARAQESKG